MLEAPIRILRHAVKIDRSIEDLRRSIVQQVESLKPPETVPRGVVLRSVEELVQTVTRLLAEPPQSEEDADRFIRETAATCVAAYGKSRWTLPFGLPLDEPSFENDILWAPDRIDNDLQLFFYNLVFYLRYRAVRPGENLLEDLALWSMLAVCDR